jgi:2-dehydropantoate 2-reductase
MSGEGVSGGCDSDDRDGKSKAARSCRGSSGRPTMKFLVAGAGALGAYIGARMARAGFDVTLIARGPHLRAMQEHGVQVKSGEEDFVALPRIAASLEEVGQVDVVFLGVKAHGLPQLAPHLKPMLGPDTTVVSTQNGIPWWYFKGQGGPLEGQAVPAVDPNGVLLGALPWTRIVGCVVYMAAEVRAPGCIVAISPHRMILGEPGNQPSERAALLCRLGNMSLLRATYGPSVV